MVVGGQYEILLIIYLALIALKHMKRNFNEKQGELSAIQAMKCDDWSSLLCRAWLQNTDAW